LEDHPDYKVYIIIPTSVCKSCSSTFNEDMMNAYKSNKLKIVFNCEFRDIPLIDLHFKHLSKDHIIIDTLKKYTICDNIPESDYPAIIYVEKNIINKTEYYNAKNPKAYEKVKSYLH
jgi:hypothetical protein